MIEQTQNDQALAEDIRDLIKYIRYLTSSNALPEDEKDDLKKLPEDQQESEKSNLIKQKRETKVKECLEQLKTKLAAAGISAETMKDIENVIKKIEDNGYNCSAQTADEIEHTEFRKETSKETKTDILAQESVNELTKKLGKATVNLLIGILKMLVYGLRLATRRRVPNQQQQHARAAA